MLKSFHAADFIGLELWIQIFYWFGIVDLNLKDVTWSSKYLKVFRRAKFDSFQISYFYAVTFSRIDPGGQLVMGFRKATISTDIQV